MIKLQDFLDLGYIVDRKCDFQSERRVLLPDEEDYPKILEIAQKIEVEYGEDSWQKTRETILNAFPKKYYLFSISRRGNAIYHIEVYFDDINAQQIMIKKGKSELSLIVEKNSERVYGVRDLCHYFCSFGSNKVIDIEKDYTIEQIILQIKKDRERNRRNILNHYNKLLRNTKAEYKRILNNANTYIKEI